MRGFTVHISNYLCMTFINFCQSFHLSFYVKIFEFEKENVLYKKIIYYYYY